MRTATKNTANKTVNNVVWPANAGPQPKNAGKLGAGQLKGQTPNNAMLQGEFAVLHNALIAMGLNVNKILLGCRKGGVVLLFNGVNEGNGVIRIAHLPKTGGYSVIFKNATGVGCRGVAYGKYTVNTQAEIANNPMFKQFFGL